MQTMDKTQSILCMNPTILQHTAETNAVEEGCMSFPNVWMKIKRPREILVHFFDEDCVEQVFKMDDVNSRIYQHELDHTLGITFKDRVSNAKWDLASRKANKINKRLADA
jgi:peptide deformylase